MIDCWFHLRCGGDMNIVAKCLWIMSLLTFKVCASEADISWSVDSPFRFILSNNKVQTYQILPYESASEFVDRYFQ